MKVEEIELRRLELKYERLRVRRRDVERRLMVSLGEVGQQNPVMVVPCEDGRRYVVMDGHKRVRVLGKLKADVVQAVVWEMTEEEALVKMYQMSTGGGRSALEEGWLVEELHQRRGWRLGEIGRRLSRSKSWVVKRLLLVEELPEWLRKEILEGRMGAHAAAHYVVPVTRVTEGAWELARKLCELSLPNRQVKEIYAHYKVGSAKVRQKIREDPILFLKAQAATRDGKQDPALSEAANRCVNKLTMIGYIAFGLVRGLPEAFGGETEQEAREKLRVVWNKSEERWCLLAKTVAALGCGRPSFSGEEQ